MACRMDDSGGMLAPHFGVAMVELLQLLKRTIYCGEFHAPGFESLAGKFGSFCLSHGKAMPLVVTRSGGGIW